VVKNYRGQGLVKQLYEYYKNCLSYDFDYAITDIAQDNPRSLKAHQKVDFEVIETLSYGGIDWYVILWDWTK
jgi:L-amino acid N-acyltransferase YncA